MTAKADINTKYIVLISFIIMLKSVFLKNNYAYIFLSDSVSVIKLNFMIAGLIYIPSEQEQLTNNLDATCSLEYNHELWVM